MRARRRAGIAAAAGLAWLCTLYLDTLERAHRPEPSASLPPRFFDTLCLLPDGSNYGCHLTAEIHDLLFLRL
jgi:hypothetical protein